MKITIPMKLPSLNEYVNECRRNKFAGSTMKKRVQADIIWYLKKLPKYDKPIFIKFTWIEANRKRDLDNVCFAKKFILDAMQELGIIPNDNSKYVTGFTDIFLYADDPAVTVEIIEEEIDND